jgi:drug/metabolite transporter (DMT)-like permease
MSASIGALLIVLVCSLAWGGLDALRKVLVNRIAPLPLICLVTTGSIPLFGLWLAVDGVPAIRAGYLAPALSSVALNVVANLAYVVAVRRAALSVTVPLLSLTPAFTALLAIPLLGERPSALQGLGVVLVVIGAFGLNLAAGEAAAERISLVAVVRSWRLQPGALWMVLVALLWALAVPLDKLAVERASGPFHGLVLNFGVACCSLAGLAATGRLRELAQVRRAAVPFAASLVVGALALGLQLVAIQLVWVGLVETLKRSVGNVMAVLFGRLLFAEPITGRKLAAVALMAAGVALVLLV